MDNGRLRSPGRGQRLALATLQHAAAAIRHTPEHAKSHERQAIQNALNESEVATALEAALIHILPATPSLFTLLRDQVLPDVYRTASQDKNP